MKIHHQPQTSTTPAAAPTGKAPADGAAKRPSPPAKPATPFRTDAFQPSTAVAASPARVTPAWLGNPTFQISRGGVGNSDHRPVSGPIQYDSWARARADTRKVGFEVWAPGVTDRDNPDLWKQLDVEVHYKVGKGAEHMKYVNLDGRSGNNAKYGLDLGQFDPYALQPGQHTPAHQAAATDMSFYFTVNGKKLDANGAPFSVHFTPGY